MVDHATGDQMSTWSSSRTLPRSRSPVAGSRLITIVLMAPGSQLPEQCVPLRSGDGVRNRTSAYPRRASRSRPGADIPVITLPPNRSVEELDYILDSLAPSAIKGKPDLSVADSSSSGRNQHGAQAMSSTHAAQIPVRQGDDNLDNGASPSKRNRRLHCSARFAKRPRTGRHRLDPRALHFHDRLRSARDSAVRRQR
jgi:hypothetical protein